MSTPLITVKPGKKGVKVRKEDGKHLSEKGEKVPRNGFWIRLLKQGDVINVDEQKKQAMAKARAAKATKAKPKKLPAPKADVELVQENESTSKGE